MPVMTKAEAMFYEYIKVVVSHPTPLLEKDIEANPALIFAYDSYCGALLGNSTSEKIKNKRNLPWDNLDGAIAHVFQAAWRTKEMLDKFEEERADWKSPDEPPDHNNAVIGTVLDRFGDRSDDEDVAYRYGKWQWAFVDESMGDTCDFIDGEVVIAWAERPEPAKEQPAAERVELGGKPKCPRLVLDTTLPPNEFRFGGKGYVMEPEKTKKKTDLGGKSGGKNLSEKGESVG